MLALAAVGALVDTVLLVGEYKKMELTLEVEHSVAIKRKKPWPQLNWLGEVGVSPIGYR